MSSGKPSTPAVRVPEGWCLVSEGSLGYHGHLLGDAGGHATSSYLEDISEGGMGHAQDVASRALACARGELANFAEELQESEDGRR